MVQEDVQASECELITSKSETEPLPSNFMSGTSESPGRFSRALTSS